MTRRLLALITVLTGLTMAAPAQALDPENTLYLDFEKGRVTIELRPDLAPQHVARIKALVREGYYDGVVFHRVIPGFMAQGGDPTGTGTGGSGQKLPAEFSLEPHVRGTVSMARTGDPNSGDSQFFIVYRDAPHLDGQYTIWGQVVEGMEVIDTFKPGDPNRGGIVAGERDAIEKATIAADVE